MTAAYQAKIQPLVDKIVREFQPEKIILFGSHAWGKPDAESDADLLVVKNSNKDRLLLEQELRARLFPSPLPFDLLVYTPSALEEKINRERNLFLEDIVTNGIVVYANDKIRG